jgi:hypothetical protein
MYDRINKDKRKRLLNQCEVINFGARLVTKKKDHAWLYNRDKLNGTVAVIHALTFLALGCLAIQSPKVF